MCVYARDLPYIPLLSRPAKGPGKRKFFPWRMKLCEKERGKILAKSAFAAGKRRGYSKGLA